MKTSELVEILLSMLGVVMLFGGMIWFGSLSAAEKYNGFHWPSFLLVIIGCSLVMGLIAWAMRPKDRGV